jgi:hypothetical protein
MAGIARTAGGGGGADSKYSGPDGGTWYPDQGRVPSVAGGIGGGSNPLLLVAILAVTGSLLQYISSENNRDRIAR